MSESRNRTFVGRLADRARALAGTAARRTSVRVLCYHGIVAAKRDPRLERNFHSVADFRQHLEILAGVDVLRTSDLADPAIWRERRKPSVIVTFDDGYANNLQAQELLAARRIPWTLFVSTGAIGTGASIWTAELGLLVLHGDASALEFGGTRWPLSRPEARQAAFQHIRLAMKRMPSRQRQSAFFDVQQQFPAGEVPRLLALFPAFRMLSWDQVRSMVGQGLEVGSHGVDHELHHAGQPEEVRRAELAQSRRAVQSELDVACAAFAFPNGDAGAYSPDEVGSAGYQLAFTMTAGPVTPESNPFLLPRFDPPSAPQAFHRLVS